MKKFVFALVFAFLGLVVATNAQNPNVVAEPEYSGVFYLRGEKGLVALPRVTPEIKARFKASLALPSHIPAEVETPIFVVKLDGTGDPTSMFMLAPVEDGKKISAKFSSAVIFTKGIGVSLRPLGNNRTFEVTPASPLSAGEYGIAVRSNTPFSVPEVFLFRVK